MIAVVIACVYLFAAVSYLERIAAERGFEPPFWASGEVFLVIGILACVIAHEAGHRIVGAARGWRCTRFGIGPFEFYREGSVWKRQRVKMLWGAFVRQMPSSFAGYRREKAMTLLGGPASSLTFGALFAAIAFTTGNPTVYALFGRLAMFTLLGVLELIPREKNGIGSDGYRLLEVLRGGPPVDDMLRESMAETSNFTPVRHRDWPHDVVVRLASGDDPYNIYIAYLHSLDAGDTEAASAYMRRLILLVPEENPYPFYACEAAWWLAIYGNDPGAARKWLDRAGPEADPRIRGYAEAAVALAAGDPARAETLAREALARIPTTAACGSDEYERDRLIHVRNAAAVCPVV